MEKLISYAFRNFRSYSSTAHFPRKPPDLKFSGNLDFSLSQKSAGKLRSYLSWKFRIYSVMANLDLIPFPQIFSRKPQILSSLETYILVFFPKLLWKRLYLTLSGNLDLNLVPQIFPEKPQKLSSPEI